MPLRPAWLVATTPTQPVKVDDCFIWGVFSVDADLNVAARGIKRGIQRHPAATSDDEVVPAVVGPPQILVRPVVFLVVVACWRINDTRPSAAESSRLGHLPDRTAVSLRTLTLPGYAAPSRSLTCGYRSHVEDQPEAVTPSPICI